MFARVTRCHCDTLLVLANFSTDSREGGGHIEHSTMSTHSQSITD